MSSDGKSRVVTVRRLALAVVAAAVATSLVATLVAPGFFRLVHRLPGGDKTGHFVIMGVVAFCVTVAFAGARPFGRRLGALVCVALVAAVVTVDELLQIVLPSRSFSVGDLTANYLGIAFFGLLAWLVVRGRSAEKSALAKGDEDI